VRTVPALVTAAMVAVLSAAPAGAAPDPGWRPVASPNASEKFNVLRDVAVVSPTEGWAVGEWLSVDGYRALVERWDGFGWQIVPGPDAGASGVPSDDRLVAVDAPAPGNVWAVGSRTVAGTAGPTPLITHGTGGTWSVFPPPGVVGGLNGVDLRTPDDGWAVGWSRSDQNPAARQGLVLHWNGATWQPSTLPPLPDASSYQLNAVTVAGVADVWAVGSLLPQPGAPAGEQALILHWDGTGWQRVAGVSLGGGGSVLLGVAAAFGEVWAVGHTYPLGSPGDEGTFKPLALHGTAGGWRLAPTVGGTGTQLRDVVVSSSTNVWVVGYRSVSGVESDHTEHWDGGTFTPDGMVRHGVASALAAVAQVPGTGLLWAVGWASLGKQTHIVSRKTF
jgi:hypothetical protein